MAQPSVSFDVPHLGKNLAAALLKAQVEFPVVEKKKTGRTGNQTYQYADLGSVLDAVRSPLAKHGILLVNTSSMDAGGLLVQAVLTHAESGESFTAGVVVPAQDDPKKLGSWMTYARRYLAQLVLGITTEEDDDGTAGQPSQAGGGGRQQGNGQKGKALKFIEQSLDQSFPGGDKPWTPVEKCRVLKDCLGTGQWKDVRQLPEAVLLDVCRMPDGDVSRLERTISLVKNGTRRPDGDKHGSPAVEAKDWPTPGAGKAPEQQQEPGQGEAGGADEEPELPF